LRYNDFRRFDKPLGYCESAFPESGIQNKDSCGDRSLGPDIHLPKNRLTFFAWETGLFSVDMLKKLPIIGFYGSFILSEW
jgi:hypothetical protein